MLANDRVQFNGTLASVTSATSTSISATVPANATSGPITIATPMGSATSSADFFVVPNAYAPSQVDFTGQMSMGGSYTGTIVNGGDIGLVLFSATAGQQINLLVNGSSIASATITILNPSGSSLGQAMIGLGGTVLDSISAPTSGIYTVLVASNGSTFTGSLTFTLSQNASSTNPPGSTTTGQIVVNTPGQTATVLFYGTAGQLASVQISNSNFPGCYSVSFSIFDPNQLNIGSGSMCGGSGFLGPVALTTSGTYTLVITPTSGSTGSASVNLSLFNEQTIPVTPVASGATSTLVTISTPGQDAQLTFSGTERQLASVQVSNSTFPGCAGVYASIYEPGNGSPLASGGACPGSGSTFLGPVALPATGPYTLEIAPVNGSTGSADVALFLFSELTGTITPGTPATVAINIPWQDDQLTFSGNKGQSASVQFSTNFSNCVYYAVQVAIAGPTGPNNQTLTYVDACGGSSSLGPVTLPANGTYTLLIAPNNGNTGIANLTLTLQ
jgi:hypothetical protein